MKSLDIKKWLNLIFITSFSLVFCVPSHAIVSDILYKSVQQDKLNHYQIKSNDIAPLIERIKKNSLFKVEQIGQSFLGKPIHSITVGNGPTKVLFWSQMHGDEPTATPAIFDLLNYIAKETQSQWRKSWHEKLTLKFIPMLNPDGADNYQRYNAQGIDINRDAKQQQTPEGKILLSMAKIFQPDFGFNLHDQRRNYAAGDNKKPATISVLAPSYNKTKEVNEVRGTAMKLIGDLVPVIEHFIPGHIGKYDDGFSERAFGDTFTALGTSTVLVESGGYYSDDNRQMPRRVNFEIMIAAINNISNKQYLKQSLDAYNAIPMNNEGGIQDVVIRNLTVNAEHSYQIDLSFIMNIYGNKKAKINEIGDLSSLVGYFEFDASNCQYAEGKAFKLSTEKPLLLSDTLYFRLLKRGYTHFVGDKSALKITTQYPVVINPSSVSTNRPKLNTSATFLLKDKSGIKLVVLDGQIYDLRTNKLLNKAGT